MRLIDADALFEFLKEQRNKETGAYSKGRNNGINIAIGAIKNEQICPTVEATVFPCKIGDPVWFVGTSNANRLKAGIIEATVEKLVLKSCGIYMKLSCNAMYETSCRSIGKSVFFSREEAEAALAKMDGGKNYEKM